MWPEQYATAQQDHAGQVSGPWQDHDDRAEEVQGNVRGGGLQLLDKWLHEYDFHWTQNVQLYSEFTFNKVNLQ